MSDQKKREINKARTKTPMREQAPMDRILNFEEVPLGYNEIEATQEALRCIDCKNKPCVAGCPVGIDIPAFLKLVGEKNFEGALRKIKEKNFLPAICGRVCPQEDQCEMVCTLNKPEKGREPGGIGRVERFLGDYAMEHNLRITPEIAPSTGKTVAIIGSGPAGLTAASDLAQKGHKVTVFEALHKPGGVLFYGIPQFRLPKEILLREIDGMKDMGVEFVMNYPVGKAEPLDSIRKRFDAVFIGTGAGLPWFLGIPGENLNGVYSANEFLTRVNLMRGYKFPDGSDTPVKKIKRIAVIGAGNTAMDSARTAKRLQPEVVYLVYRRSRLEMPARLEEIHHAEQEGIDFHLLHSPIEIVDDGKGAVGAIRCQEMELGEPDASGRRRPVPIEGKVREFAVDTVVISIGQGPNPLLSADCPELARDAKKGTIVIDENMQTSFDNVFAGGDIVTGGATVILAMGQGRVAADAMHRYLTTGDPNDPAGRTGEVCPNLM
ncbi:NADPH-dependent glutamate synthase [bacterium]|nr:NADPH-dependent glutamate synthase [bacterium]